MKSSFRKQLISFFNSEQKEIGSRDRLLTMLNQFSNLNTSDPNFLIAGSWGIEIISGKQFNHDDIDVIVLDTSSYYLDDAREIEEKCNGLLPISTSFLKKTFVQRKYARYLVYVPNHNLQICLKIIGQLQEELQSRALGQLIALLESYLSFDKNDAQYEIEYILRKLLPPELNPEIMSKNMVAAIEKYLRGDKNLQEFKRIHALINKAFRYQFEKRGLTKRIKISER